MATDKPNSPMPVLYVSHGSPLLAIDQVKADQYKQWGQALARPEAILVFSAHWENSDLMFGETQTHNALVYDFSGFPESLYHLQYPAPGSPWLAERVQALLADTMTIAVTNRGLDHGVWVPFLHLWPDADIPVLQMSMPANLSDRALYDLGSQLAPLRQQGVLIVGSGMLTHNLAEWNPQYRGQPLGWAVEFDDWVKQTLLEHDQAALLDWQTRAPAAARNHPTPEHFRPLLIVAGAANRLDVSFPITGFDAGVFSTRSVQFG